MRKTSSYIALSISTFILVSSSFTADAKSPRELATALAEIRGEVETLATQLEESKENHRSRMRSLETQKTDLKLELQRETLQLKQLQAKLQTIREETKSVSVAQKDLTPAIKAAVKQLKASIITGLPYHLEDRLQELQKVEDQMNDGLIAPGQAAARLWEKVEDELRLTRESQLDRQVIKVQGKSVLSDVIHLGMVMMFFRTPDNEFGRAVKKNGSWAFEIDAKPENQPRLTNLFETFEKRIRVGFFEIPNALETK
ncbi:MAG: DUF3450 family protein [Myxococcota bacterium]|nr:DUF3450 family protein [Myxococcota bacterium]